MNRDPKEQARPPEWHGPFVCTRWALDGARDCEGRLHTAGGGPETNGNLFCRKHCGCGQDEVSSHRPPREPVSWAAVSK